MADMQRTVLDELIDIQGDLKVLIHRLDICKDAPRNYLETAVITTLAGVTGITNSIIQSAVDITHKKVHYIDLNAAFTVYEMYKAQYQTFFVQLLNSVELGCAKVCKENGWQVVSLTKRSLVKGIKALGKKLKLEGEALAVFEEYQKGIEDKHIKLLFNDYISRVLKHSRFEGDEKAQWIAFFEALPILRNKAAHSDPSLDEDEIAKLEKAGLHYMLWESKSPSGKSLGLSPDALLKIGSRVADFLDRLYEQGVSKDDPELLRGDDGWVEGVVGPTEVSD